MAAVAQPILGLQQLGRLRHMTMDAHGLSFGTAVAFPCSDPLIASALRGGYRSSLLIPISLDGNTMMAEFDSGEDSPEAVTIRGPNLLARLSAHLVDEDIETIGGRSRQTIVVERTRLTIGQSVMDDAVKYVPSRATVAPNVSTHAFRHDALRFDWTEHKACFGLNGGNAGRE